MMQNYNDIKVAICCIAKMENLYLRDFVEYYKRIGVDNIILYDNNDKFGEMPRQVIGDYIDSGFVIYRDYRGKYRCQLDAYNECYEEFKGIYDWIGFIDVDEFIEIESKKSIKEWIGNEKFSEAFIIYLWWISYGDNELLHYDNRPVYERFLTPQSNVGENTTVKLFVRCDIDSFVNFNDVNQVFITRNSVPEIAGKMANGEPDNNGKLPSLCFEGAYIKHYHTLTIDEFLCKRFGRQGYADKATEFTKERVLKIFWDINKRTPEKEKIIEDFFKNYEIVEDRIK